MPRAAAKRRTEAPTRRALRRAEAAEHLASHLAAPGTSGLFTRLTRVALRLQELQERCLEPLGLRFVEFSVLRVLELSGRAHRPSPARLAEIVLRPSGGMTQILDRLERGGLVERSPDPSDRRRVTVALTRAGLGASRRASKRYETARKEILTGLSAAECESIDAAVRRLLVVFGDPDEPTRRRP